MLDVHSMISGACFYVGILASAKIHEKVDSAAKNHPPLTADTGFTEKFPYLKQPSAHLRVLRLPVGRQVRNRCWTMKRRRGEEHLVDV